MVPDRRRKLYVDGALREGRGGGERENYSGYEDHFDFKNENSIF